MKANLDQYRMASWYKAFTVSRSGYYAWLKRPQHRGELQGAIRACHQAHKARVGAPSIHAELAARGFSICARTVGKQMSALGLRAKGSKKFKRTTDSNHNQLISANLLEPQFTVSQPNQAWVGDITYIRTDQGSQYASRAHSKLLKAYGFQQSVSRRGQALCACIL